MVKNKTWIYHHVNVVKVIDGDTVVLEIDLGNRCWWYEHFRLYGYNAPEPRGESRVEGMAATQRLRELLVDGVVAVETLRPNKYGRTFAKVFIMQDGLQADVADIMVAEGHGLAYAGVKQ